MQSENFCDFWKVTDNAAIIMQSEISCALRKVTDNTANISQSEISCGLWRVTDNAANISQSETSCGFWKVTHIAVIFCQIKCIFAFSFEVKTSWFHIKIVSKSQTLVSRPIWAVDSALGFAKTSHNFMSNQTHLSFGVKTSWFHIKIVSKSQTLVSRPIWAVDFALFFVNTSLNFMSKSGLIQIRLCFFCLSWSSVLTFLSYSCLNWIEQEFLQASSWRLSKKLKKAKKTCCERFG